MSPRRGVSFDESAIEADRRARAAGEYATQKIDIPDTPFLYYDSDEEAEARTVVREYVRGATPHEHTAHELQRRLKELEDEAIRKGKADADARAGGKEQGSAVGDDGGDDGGIGGADGGGASDGGGPRAMSAEEAAAAAAEHAEGFRAVRRMHYGDEASAMREARALLAKEMAELDEGPGGGGGAP